MGVAVGIVCFWACTYLKGKFKYDDSLDAFGVHGVGGTLGAILTGVFATVATGATASIEGVPKGTPLGLLEGGTLLVGQIAAVAITWVLAAVATLHSLEGARRRDGPAGLGARRDPGPGPEPTRRRRVHFHLRRMRG